MPGPLLHLTLADGRAKIVRAVDVKEVVEVDPDNLAADFPFRDLVDDAGRLALPVRCLVVMDDGAVQPCRSAATTVGRAWAEALYRTAAGRPAKDDQPPRDYVRRDHPTGR